MATMRPATVSILNVAEWPFRYAASVGYERQANGKQSASQGRLANSD